MDEPWWYLLYFYLLFKNDDTIPRSEDTQRILDIIDALIEEDEPNDDNLISKFF